MVNKHILLAFIFAVFSIAIVSAQCPEAVLSQTSISSVPPESFQYDSREVSFKGKIKILTGLYKNGATIDKTQLYELGRAYRKKLEDQLQEIEKSGQNTTSDYLVLKQVYKFFDYCNPLGRSIGDDMPGFEPDIKCNKALYKRWSDLYEQAFRDARDMYDYGDKLYGPQVYELARA